MSAPSVIITLPYEGQPSFTVHADSLEDERAVWLWLRETPALLRLADEVLSVRDWLRGEAA
jgi:hypothetical protein